MDEGGVAFTGFFIYSISEVGESAFGVHPLDVDRPFDNSCTKGKERLEEDPVPDEFRALRLDFSQGGIQTFYRVAKEGP